MGKGGMSDLLKRRMTASQQASELKASDEAYQKIFRELPPPAPAAICDLPLDKLIPFFTADIGFKPYPPSKLKAFAEQLSEEGLMVRIIVRPMGDGSFEILAGHNRANAAKLAGWTKIPAEVVDADDARAIVIATSTNLIQRQELSVIERGKAYSALLGAKSRQGMRTDLIRTTSGENQLKSGPENGTLGEYQPKYSARALVAEFFGVTEYEVRKAVKLTRLIPELCNIIENTPKQLNLACADLIADYDVDSSRRLWKYAVLRAIRLIRLPCSTSLVDARPRSQTGRLFSKLGGKPETQPTSGSPPRPGKSLLIVKCLRRIWKWWAAIRSWRSCFWSFCGNG